MDLSIRRMGKTEKKKFKDWLIKNWALDKKNRRNTEWETWKKVSNLAEHNGLSAFDITFDVEWAERKNK